ncbi:SulP family inorganic anion transporter, partial [Thioclava sp. BHET1]
QRPMLPGALIILACGVLASALLDPGTRGVALVGPIGGLSSLPGLPILPAGSWSRLAPYILPLMLILFAESWGTISALGLRHGDSPRANRELLALGLSNLGAGLLHGMPVGAGFSAGAANEGAGAQSRWACVIAAAGLAGLVTLAAPLVAALPLPVLAAVVIGTLLHGLNPAPFLKLRHQRMDLALALIAAFGVLIFGVLNGMLLAVALSIAALIRRMAAPRLDRLGQLGAGHDYVDLARHAEAISPSGITIWRPAAPLFFANAEPVLSEILRATETPGLILSLEESADLDSSALEALQDFAARAEQQGMALQLARVHDHLRDRLREAGAEALLDQASYSTADAVRALQAHLPANRARSGSITQA